jgi:hypothetical protein
MHKTAHDRWLHPLSAASPRFRAEEVPRSRPDTTADVLCTWTVANGSYFDQTFEGGDIRRPARSGAVALGRPCAPIGVRRPIDRALARQVAAPAGEGALPT